MKARFKNYCTLALGLLSTNLLAPDRAYSESSLAQLSLNQALSELQTNDTSIGENLGVSLQINGRVERLKISVRTFELGFSGGQVKGVLPGFGTIIATSGPSTMNIYVSGPRGNFEYAGPIQAEYPLSRPIRALFGSDIVPPREPAQKAVEITRPKIKLEENEK